MAAGGGRRIRNMRPSREHCAPRSSSRATRRPLLLNMPAAPAQPTHGPGQTHLLLYDGDCGLCTASCSPSDARPARRIPVRPTPGRRRPDGGRATGRRTDRLTTFYVVPRFETPEANMLTKSAAALFVAGELGWPWRAARARVWCPHASRPRLRLRRATRYTVFGRRDQCFVPRPELRSRFLDEER